MKSQSQPLRAPTYTPEVRNNLVATIRDLLVLLGATLCDLEAFVGEDGVARVGAATNLAAIQTVAEDLQSSAQYFSGSRTTYAGFALALNLIADITAHASTGRHIGQRLEVLSLV